MVSSDSEETDKQLQWCGQKIATNMVSNDSNWTNQLLRLCGRKTATDMVFSNSDETDQRLKWCGRKTPIHEQVREKRELFSTMTHQCWSVQHSLDIFDEGLNFHHIDADDFATATFEVCHKIRPQNNALHITSPSNLGKSFEVYETV